MQSGEEDFRNGTLEPSDRVGTEFHQDDIVETWGTSTNDHAHHFKDQIIDTPVCRGRTNFEEFSPGLFLGNSDLEFLADITVDVTREPCFMMCVLMDGDMHMRLGNQNLSTSAVKQVGIAFHEKLTTESDLLAGQRTRMAGLVAKREWLSDNRFDWVLDGGLGSDSGLALNGATIWEADVPTGLASFAERLINISIDEDPLPTLRREALVMEFFAAGLTNLTPAHPDESVRRLSSQEWKRIRDVRDFIDQAQFDNALTLEQIARENGMSPSMLNRHFKLAFDTTVIAYLSERRMNAAWEALTQDGVQVAQAAYLAGFSNASNFSTAFRKRYGEPPKEARRRHFPVK